MVKIISAQNYAGVDSRSYGAILIDLERRVPIDLLPDREAETFKKWLLAHPGVEIISRDRGGSFARCGKAGSAQSQAGRRSLALTQKSLGDDAELLSQQAISAPVPGSKAIRGRV